MPLQIASTTVVTKEEDDGYHLTYNELWLAGKKTTRQPQEYPYVGIGLIGVLTWGIITQ